MPSVIRNSRIETAPDKEIDVELTAPTRFVGTHANIVPLFNTAQSPRLFYAARFVNQAMPIKNRETPLVQALDPEDPDGRSFEDLFGERMGARYFKDKEGEVVAVTPDNISIKLPDGNIKDIDLYNNFQFNRKTQLSNKPLVKVGDKVKKNQILASSNFTDDAGTVSMGINARVALVPYQGYSMDDAIVVSESFAKRLTSEHNYAHELSKEGDLKFGKTHYTALFPRQFTKDQLSTLDDDGVVKPGTVLRKGDPIILATKPKTISSNSHLGKLGKTFRQMRSDATEVWDHDYPGIVTDSVYGKKNARVFVNADVPLKVGDKQILRNGQKCYSADTEILTDRGWVAFPDLRESDKVAALFDRNNTQDFYTEFVEPIAYAVSDFEGELFGFENKDVSYLVTGNHRVWCKVEDTFKCITAEQAHNKKNLTFMKDLSGSDIQVEECSGFFKQPYKGKVYCVQVSGLGIVLTRRNDKQVWCGNSIVSKILPDEQMLRSVDGKPFEVLLNPLALPSRVNAATPYELLLGKLAALDGKPVKVASFGQAGKSRLDEVKAELEKRGISDTEEVFDPLTNRKLEKPVTTGIGYFYKLHHVVDSKISARGQGSYSVDEQPVKGGGEGAQAKRLGGLETTALMAHGAYATLREGATLRGQKNDDYWRLVRQGYTPAEPGKPFVWEKFKALLNGAGYMARDLGKGTLRLSPFTEKDLEKLKPIELKNAKSVNMGTLEPEAGGLFDSTIVAGNRWGKITLPVTVPNPAFEKQIQQLLGITNADMRKVIAGEMTLKEAQANKTKR